MKIRLSKTNYLDVFKAVHGDKYSYEYLIYTKANDYSTITCKEHGNFQQVLSEHARGKGCPYCGGVASTKEIFVEKANKVHNGKYTYESLDFKGGHIKGSMTCPTHGLFTQSPSMHLQGRGCSKCTKMGYSPVNGGSIYVFTVDNIVKVGITSKPIVNRLSQIRKFSGKHFELHFFIKFENGQIPLDIETQILRELNASYKRTPESYNGSTECFVGACKHKVTERIIELCYQNLIKD